MRQPNGRGPLDLRPLSIETNVNRYAEGSALIKAGHTHVLCSASVAEEVPNWLKGKGQGWVTAEYGMLPRSTHTRMKREREKLSGRTQEIQRLIGRAFRTVVDLKKLGERSITVDCDVIQADGGTRTAAITGGYVALVLALQKLLASGKISADPILDSVAAVSIGLRAGEVLVDLDYDEDSTIDVDMNFVVTGAGTFVEVQGTGEKLAFNKAALDAMTDAALLCTKRLAAVQNETLREA